MALSTLGNAWAQTRVGISIPFSGSFAIFGSEIGAGIHQAVEDLNTQGGILGQPIELVLYDDQCLAPQGARIAQRLTDQEKVAFVIGPLCSSTAQAMVPIFGSRSDFVIDILMATAPVLTEKGYSNIFRILPRGDRQGPIAGAYLQRIKADYNIAILNDETPHAAEIIASLRQAWSTLDIDTKFQGRYSSSQPSFAPLIEQLRAANIKVIFVAAGIPLGLGKLVAEARTQHYPALFVATEEAWSPELSSVAGEGASGILFTFFPVPTRNAQTEAVVAKMKRNGPTPGARALYAYAAMQVLAQAITKAETVNVPKVKTALHEGQFDTVIGPVAFDSKGDIKEVTYEFYRSQERTITQLNNRPPPPPPPPPR